ncbi:MAG: BatA domain-containing protein [Planctomycetaceae bacterium]|nr:BatA domain-containing protein [Planctomycetaceae bacterium]
MNFLSPWIAEHFLNPALFWPGMALIAAPILIHLINRLRYRRVRFAAMEFLLSSQQQNRRRILLEQLLLLLLRVGIVALLALLISRLIVDPSQLTLFQGAKSHHVFLLDDSGSMRDRMGEETTFDRAKAVILKLATEGARRPGTQRFTLLLMSQPDSTYSNLGERDINTQLVEELAAKLEALACTHQRVDLVAGLEAVQQRLADDRSAARHLHILSDFRKSDWVGAPTVTETIKALDESQVSINFIHAVPDAHENLGITIVTGAVEVAAAGIPVQLSATVQNFGQREATDVRLSVIADGERLPLNLLFESIAAGKTEQRGFDVRFVEPGKHRIEVTLEADALEADNTRHLAINVPLENEVLIVDGSPGSEQGLFIADALAADRTVTGYAPIIDNVSGMRRRNLDAFQSIILINVSELPPDAIQAVQKFVAAGGGLVWYLGDAIRSAYYNEALYQQGAGLFPVPLSGTPQTLDHPLAATGPDILVSNHPMFSILSGQNNPFIDVVTVNQYLPIEPEVVDLGSDEIGQAKVIARLRNREPLILEHTYGEGRVVTFLTSAGPLPTTEGSVWNNWASGAAAPSFAVMQLELQKYIARRNRSQPQRIVGEPIEERLNRADYLEDLEIVTPDDDVLTLKAAAPEAMTSDDGSDVALTDDWVATFRETDEPGVYIVRRFDHQQQADETWMAYNVPVEESDLTIADEDALRQQWGEEITVAIHEGDALDWIRNEPPGQDVRWWLLAGLLLLFVGEQGLAYRLGYH